MSKTIKIHTGSLNINNGSVLEWAPIALAIVPTIPKPKHWKTEQWSVIGIPNMFNIPGPNLLVCLIMGVPLPLGVQ